MSKLDANLDFDAIVIGGGFSGIYAVHRLKNELNLDVIAFEKGGHVGGTWYWNRYPGALSDTESFVYRFSFDKELLQEYTWTHNYLTQKEVLNYLTHVTERYNIKDNFKLNTEVTKVKFNEDESYWEVTTNHEKTYTAQFLICGLGLLSAVHKPNIPGIDNFKGQYYHTAQWPENADYKGKKVGVIGTGSTGIQLITAIAPEVEHLTVFQRTAQYNVPLGYRKQSEEEIAEIKANYDQIWDTVRNSVTAFGYPDTNISAMDHSEEEREAKFEEAWKRGNGFYFLNHVFNDLATNREANDAAANFIKKKIKEIVKDPETAEKLTPKEPYARRPCANDGYYYTFNRDNVSLVDIKANPIVEVTEKGIRTTEGEHELDVIIFATGFDAMDGNYTKFPMIGRNNVVLKDKWKNGSRSYLGIMESDFPNMFMSRAPLSSFTNNPPAIESELGWAIDLIKYLIDNNLRTAEPTKEAVDGWYDLCLKLSEGSLFGETQSWIFGANIPGKPVSVRFYMGGMGNYNKELEKRGFSELVFDKALEKSDR
ncbi:flavin-containing monooxygenase [Ureibacillus endophyticus]|uniref:NAD(P)/FAD-dependent oxidoreductase n=1 Tax=Ureibacillus endophyticus TaxID=1978490 RepID=A0A494YYR3_9BACL|nr:NAD(P)/FAD-dependent oxidoreductase [Lysinibacillus endophyticus]RKQ15144.1 NAD(P)/FAD-dependent oxidoreductase [Lysinibacillus endophyticus]